MHSLEPLRPWKAEQLGGGYALSSWCERVSLEGADAVIAVSEGSRRDILDAYPAIDPGRVEVIYNGIDAEQYTPDPAPTCWSATASTPTGRRSSSSAASRARRACRTCVDAALEFDPEAQLVLCAGAPDTPEIGADVERRVERLREERGNVIWLDQMLPKAEVIQLLSHATVFACPSIYEPLGIVNLEAMACEAAVVATATGGIVEVVVDGETGLLVPVRAGARQHRAARPGGVLPRDRRAGQRPDRRSGAGRGDGQGGPRARRRGVRLVRDRGADGGRLSAPAKLTPCWNAARRSSPRSGPRRTRPGCSTASWRRAWTARA